MHVVRSRARHVAWSADDPPPYSIFNPFRRIDSRQREYEDEENRLSINDQNHSDGCLDETVARQSRSRDIGNTGEGAQFEGPRHSSTAPPASASADESSSPSFPKTNSPTAAADTTSSYTPPPPADSQTNGHISMRRRLHLPFGKKGESDGGEVKRIKSSKSSNKKQHFTFWGQIKAIFGQWINIVLVCVPVGIVLHVIDATPVAVFVVNFLAIMPLAGLLSFSTEELALRVGETLGGLLNASFGNAVELIVSIIALVHDEIIIVKTSLIGSMLSNLLLVMGMCFFFGGINRLEQFFNVTVAQTAASLLSLAVGSIIIPTVFHRWGTGGSAQEREKKIPALSRGTAITLLFVYGCYLFFQLKTHEAMYNAPSQKSPKTKSSKDKEGSLKKGLVAIGAGSAIAPASGTVSGTANEAIQQEPEKIEEDEQEQPTISVTAAILTLCISTAFIGVNSEFMVDGIAGLKGISPEFVGLILIPIVGNAAEHATAVTVAVKDKMDLAIGVAVGSSMQISLLVLPIVVIVGWIIGNDDMTLEFDGFLLALLFVSVLLVNYLIGDGRSHWLEGVMLLAMYILTAVAAWFYPATQAVVG